MSGIKRLPEDTRMTKFRSFIINGDMEISQRGTTFTFANTSTLLSNTTLDTWGFTVEAGTGKWTITQSFDGPSDTNLLYSLKANVTEADNSLSANSRAFIYTYIEGGDLQSLKFGTNKAKNITLSFWVKSNLTGTYVVELHQRVGVNSPPSFPTGNGSSAGTAAGDDKLISALYTINQSNTWQQVKIVFPPNTINRIPERGPDYSQKASLGIKFWLAAGSNYTSSAINTTSWKTWTDAERANGQVNLAGTLNNYFNLTGVQLEEGKNPSDFEFIPRSVQRSLCERYFEISYIDPTSIGAISSSCHSSLVLDKFTANNGEYAYFGTINFNERKINIPSVTVYSTSGNINKVTVGFYNSTTECTGNITTYTTQKGSFITAMHNSNTLSMIARFQWTAESNTYPAGHDL